LLNPLSDVCAYWPQVDSSIVLFNHHPQQLRNPVRRDVDVLTRLSAEAVVPILRRQVIAIDTGDGDEPAQPVTTAWVPIGSKLSSTLLKSGCTT